MNNIPNNPQIEQLPLSVSFLHHPQDKNSVQTVISGIEKLFLRDNNRPYSRSVNIPLFFYTTEKDRLIPNDITYHTCKNIIYVFLSKNILGDDVWYKYLQQQEENSKKLPEDNYVKFLYITLDAEAFHYSSSFEEGSNFLRMHEFSEDRNKNTILTILHEINRWGLNIGDNSKDRQRYKETSVKVFLSHAKMDKLALKNANLIKKFINTNSSLNVFFDKNDIVVGSSFEQEIEKGIGDSTVLIIRGDNYSSRYWCQQELYHAKKLNKPIVEFNCSMDIEDRSSIMLVNTPVISANGAELSNDKILDVLIALILETIKFNYNTEYLESLSNIKYYQVHPTVPDIYNIFELPHFLKR